MEAIKPAKLSLKIKIGYGLCTAADTIPYNLFYIYFLYFLTDIAGVAPALAGTITGISLVWDAITDPIVGGLSDRMTSDKGKRIPFMKYSVIPLAIIIYALFAPWELAGAGQNAYYIIVSILLWTLYTTFVIPYFSLGAEMTADYGERNILRFMTMIIAYPLLMLVSSGPMWIWAWAGNQGYSDRAAWGYTGIAFALLLAVMCGIGIFMLKGCEKNAITMLKEKAQESKENFFRIIAEILKLRPYRIICFFTVVYLFGFSMLNTVFIYIMTYNAEMTAVQQGIFWTLYSCFVVVTLPFITMFCNKFGKKETMMVTMAIAIIGSFFFYFKGINSYADMLIFAATSVIGSSSFFTFYIGYAYDCIEIDEFKTGKRREGSMTALISFCQKFGSAIAMWVTGVLLAVVGYDGALEIQSDAAVHGILQLGTLYPAFLFIIAYIIFSFYPVTIKNFNALCEALEKKRKGEDYSTSGFEKILK
ncbi:MAG: MFS transporter [Clostridia bacterium]|nr:MFS transporter [Clostridia bacterium]